MYNSRQSRGLMKEGKKKHNIGHPVLTAGSMSSGTKIYLVPGTHAEKPSAPEILFVAVWHMQRVLVHLRHRLCCPGCYDSMIK